jgi:hypothetical protein
MQPSQTNDKEPTPVERMKQLYNWMTTWEKYNNTEKREHDDNTERKRKKRTIS